MFRSPTVLVVGAGASLEAGLPIGSELLRKLSSSLNLNFQFNQLQGGDPRIENALRRYCMKTTGDQQTGIELMNEYIHAGWRIAEAAKEGLSIDAIIDQHENDRVEFMGKLGIAREMLKAESGSKLRGVEGRVDELSLDRCKDTWLPRLGRLLVEGRKISAVDDIFENLTIITFNYDRCIEQYLPFSLVSHYGIKIAEARELTNGLCIYHPFGTLGRLPWQEGEGPVVEFGNAEQADLVTVSRQIQTFTEQMEDEQTLNAMRSAMERADRIVFLGFAYHRPNLDLLAPPNSSKALSLIGTCKNISSADQEVVQVEVGQMLGLPAKRLNLLDLTCSELFDENWRSLTAAVP